MSTPDPVPSIESLLTHSEWLASLARRLMVDRASADDLVQDTWIAALRNPPRDAHALRAWLGRVARRLARVRDPLRDPRTARAAAREDSAPTDEVVARIEEERLLARLVLELEEPYRNVVLQRFYIGHTAARIARNESVPAATVRTRLRRGLGLLRERLERERGRDPRTWPLAAFVLLRDGGPLNALNKGVLLMSTKTTIALSVASGALCALAVTEGILPQLTDETSLATTRTAAVAPSSSRSSAPVTVVDRTADENDALIEPSRDNATTGQPLEARVPQYTTQDLRELLFSSKRIDQVRAIELLQREGSAAANQILLDALLTSKDPVLLALLEEALVASPLVFEPSVMSAFLASEDAQTLERLGRLLTSFVNERPELEERVVGALIGTLDAGNDSRERSVAATAALVALGARAADELGHYMANRDSSPRGVGSAAWAIAKLSAEHDDLVREKLSEGLRSLHGFDDPSLTEDERDALLKKTGSIGWVATLRPLEEHDRLSEALLDRLLETQSEEQAGTLVWSLENLKGLTGGARVDISRQLLDALSQQTDAALRQQYAQVLKNLAIDQPVGPNFQALLQLAQIERNGQAPNSPLAPLLDRLIAELQAHASSSGH